MQIGPRPRPGSVPPRAAARPFFLGGLAYLTLGLLTGLAAAMLDPRLLLFGTPWRWAVVHLALLGGLSQFMFGAMPFFLVALLATTPPPRLLLRGQWLCLNLGTALLVLWRLLGLPALAWAGGLLAVLAFALLLAGLRTMAAAAIGRIGAAARFYFTSGAFVLVGSGFGLLMATGLDAGILSRSHLRLTHLHLNLVGWVALTIVGTMLPLLPTTLPGASRPGGGLLRAEYWLFTAGAAGLGLGLLASSPLLVGFAAALPLAGAVVLAGWTVGLARRASAPLPAPARLLVGASLFLAVSALLGGAVATAATAGWALPVGVALAYGLLALLGFVSQTLMGALLHLLPLIFTPAGPPGSLAGGTGRARTVLARGAAARLAALNGGTLALAAGVVAAGLGARGEPAGIALVVAGAGAVALSWGWFLLAAARVVASAGRERSSW